MYEMKQEKQQNLLFMQEEMRLPVQQQLFLQWEQEKLQQKKLIKN